MTRKLILILVVMVSFGALSGCQSYVNIPSQLGDVAEHDPNLVDVLKVELQAAREVYNLQPTEKNCRLVLPEGTLPQSYDAVAGQVGTKVSWSAAATQPDEYVLECKQVRLRGWYAQVDVIRPWDPNKADSPKQLVTVSLKCDLIVGWYVTATHPWRESLSDALVESVRSAEIDIRH